MRRGEGIRQRRSSHARAVRRIPLPLRRPHPGLLRHPPVRPRCRGERRRASRALRRGGDISRRGCQVGHVLPARRRGRRRQGRSLRAGRRDLPRFGIPREPRGDQGGHRGPGPEKQRGRGARRRAVGHRRRHNRQGVEDEREPRRASRRGMGGIPSRAVLRQPDKRGRRRVVLRQGGCQRPVDPAVPHQGRQRQVQARHRLHADAAVQHLRRPRDILDDDEGRRLRHHEPGIPHPGHRPAGQAPEPHQPDPAADLPDAHGQEHPLRRDVAQRLPLPQRLQPQPLHPDHPRGEARGGRAGHPFRAGRRGLRQRHQPAGRRDSPIGEGRRRGARGPDARRRGGGDAPGRQGQDKERRPRGRALLRRGAERQPHRGQQARHQVGREDTRDHRGVRRRVHPVLPRGRGHARPQARPRLRQP